MAHARPVAILLAALILCAAWADDAPVDPVQGPALLAEVNILYRIVPLQLTDDQLDRILAVYDQASATRQAALESETGRVLLRFQAHLIQGVTPTAAEVEELRLLARDALSERDAAAGLDDLLTAVEAILTPRQQAILARQGPAGLAGDKTRRYAADQVLNRLGPYLTTPDEEWPDLSSRLAASLASGVADPDLRANAEVDIQQYLDRVRDMEPADRAARREELSEELCALLPDGLPVSWEVPLEAPEDVPPPEQANGRRDRARQKNLSVFALPETPTVLASLKRARADRAL